MTVDNDALIQEIEDALLDGAQKCESCFSSVASPPNFVGSFGCPFRLTSSVKQTLASRSEKFCETSQRTLQKYTDAFSDESRRHRGGTESYC